MVRYARGQRQGAHYRRRGRHQPRAAWVLRRHARRAVVRRHASRDPVLDAAALRRRLASLTTAISESDQSAKVQTT